MLDNFNLWIGIFHIFMFSLLIYSILHKLWENSKTTIITICGFQAFGILLQFTPIGVTIIFLMLFMLFIYFRAITKSKKYWSKYECLR